MDDEPEQPGESNRSAFRTLPQDEIVEILRRHHEWIEAGGRRGAPADLSRVALAGFDLAGAVLSEAKLAGADLRGAILARADLGGADLTGADLRNADLSRANLETPAVSVRRIGEGGRGGSKSPDRPLGSRDPEPTCLTGAKLQGAQLCDAKLADVCGLLSGSLAGADLSNAKLPDDIARFDGLENVAETSRNAATVFFGLLGACLYSGLTIATTTHAGLVVGTDDLTLPIIGAPIPTTEFYFAAPVMLLMIYVYFHLYLERLWVGLATLPAVFPDGRTLDEKAYPWICNTVARAHFRLLAPRRGPMTKLEYFVTVALGWFVVPVTLAYFWLGYLPTHHWPVTWVHVALTGAALGFGIYSYHVAVRTLRGEAVDANRAGTRTTIMTLGLWTMFVGAFVLMTMTTRWIHDQPLAGDPSGSTRFGRFTHSLLGDWTYLDIRGADISVKPANWNGATDARFALVKGADLQGADLRHMSAEGAFFAKARLHGADLRGARLALADFRQAVFTAREASGQNAMTAQAASAQQARPEVGCFDGRNSANLRGADIWRADLRETELCGADLGRAILVQAKLSGADLRKANLEGANLAGADLSPIESETFGIRRADLSMALLKGADLRGANLQGAILRGVDLRDADLTGVMNLLPEQLREACINEKTALPSGFWKEMGSVAGSCGYPRGSDADTPTAELDQDGEQGTPP
ncbi:pentapeptide repeat-containing protein [Skermanella pratensis]|uniref:pentapeptide repeat-containing protein n=1 Tax=Skermanella pratensis TaxID=2233999 RepID=UPI0013010BC6|nr:pentapeptide repeat-containing protein [Skermanella pratensis]